jgi:uncharacterized membrane protein (UPF0127 family)
MPWWTSRGLFVALISLSSLACSACRSDDPPPAAPALTQLTISSQGTPKVTLSVEVVASNRGRQRGLMFRDHLEDGKGMLFVFDSEQEHPFWMKNTLIPLDIIFLDSNRQIVGIIHNATPKREDNLSVGIPSRFVLEVPGGYCNRTNIHRGDAASFDL